MTLEEYLKSESCSLLKNILNELKNVNHDKWSLKSIDDLYLELLTSGESLLADLTVRELQVISQELLCITGPTCHTSNTLKSEIVNSVVRAFGRDIVTAGNSSRRNKNFLILKIRCKSAQMQLNSLHFPFSIYRFLLLHCKWCKKEQISVHQCLCHCQLQFQLRNVEYKNTLNISVTQTSTKRGIK